MSVPHGVFLAPDPAEVERNAEIARPYEVLHNEEMLKSALAAADRIIAAHPERREDIEEYVGFVAQALARVSYGVLKPKIMEICRDLWRIDAIVQTEAAIKQHRVKTAAKGRTSLTDRGVKDLMAIYAYERWPLDRFETLPRKEREDFIVDLAKRMNKSEPTIRRYLKIVFSHQCK